VFECPYICLYAVATVTITDRIRMSRLLIKLVKLHCSPQAMNTLEALFHASIFV